MLLDFAYIDVCNILIKLHLLFKYITDVMLKKVKFSMARSLLV